VPEPTDPPPAQPQRSRPLGTYLVCAVLLLAPFVALLWVSSYAKETPRLLGFPFFYWYQLLWVLVSAVLTYVAYLLVRRVEYPRPRLHEREGGPR
jgi:membrane protein implicated in regulation of membrane protease activity